MIGKYTAVIIIVIFINLISQSHSQKEGQACEKDGIPGTCVVLSRCGSALKDERTGKNINLCNYTGRRKVVCCIPSIEIATQTFSSIPASTMKIKKTGRKAADKCNDWKVLKPKFIEDLSRATKIIDDQCLHIFHFLPLVTGGEEAEIDEFPHMALLGYNNSATGEIIWPCAGTLISERWVMTAGHCIWLPGIDADVEYVRLGSDDKGVVSDPQQMYTIEEIKPHPDYNFLSIYNDIALPKLTRDAVFSKSVFPACLQTESPSNNILRKFTVTGWGNVDNHQTETKKLMKVELEQFNFTECIRKLKPSRKFLDGVRAATQICAGHRTEIKDSCQGDSGGPLQFNILDLQCTYAVVGIVSTGIGCGTPGRPALYTRVLAFIPWIESIVWP